MSESMTPTLDAIKAGPRYRRDCPLDSLLIDLASGTGSERGSATRELMARGYHNVWGQLDLPAELYARADQLVAAL